MSYARETSVTPEKSIDDIRREVKRFGADKFLIGDDLGGVTIMFRYDDRVVRFALTFPDRSEFSKTPKRNQRRSKDAVDAAWAAEVRRLHRSLYLCIKAKLVAIEDRVSTFDDEFMPFIVGPDGRTFGEHMRPRIREMIASANRPQMPLLPGGTS